MFSRKVELQPETGQIRLDPGSGKDFQILLSACKTFLGTADPADLEDALNRGPNWDNLSSLALRHGVMPLLYHSVSRNCADAVPEDRLSLWRRQFLQNAGRNMKMTAELLRILEALEGAGVCAVPLKGPVLAQTVYGDLGLRQFTDLDLLVKPEEVEDALQVLNAADYVSSHQLDRSLRQRLMKTAHHHHLFNARTGITVELHWTIAPSYYRMHADASRIIERSEAVLILGRRVRSVRPDDMLMLLCQHGTKHTWERLSWICDVAATARMIGPEMEEEAWRRSQGTDEERALLLGLVMAQDMLGTEVPEPMAGRARADRAISDFGKEAAKRLFSEREESEDRKYSQIDRSLLYMKLYRSPWKKARYFFSMITDPADVDLSRNRRTSPPFRLKKLLRMADTYSESLYEWLRRSRDHR
ncbi:MAG: nucleotidyltransferase family protein [Methanotrichaceae archaeon]|nr:nucleotidyltransferase family protein [Methanotrichaceae archaeon]